MMFVPIDANSGPLKDIRLKILPKGSTSFPGIILSAPCLAPAPLGLGLRTEKHAHVLTTLGICLPRMEEARREQVQVNFLLDTAQISLCPGATVLAPVRASLPYVGARYTLDHPDSLVQLAAIGPVSRSETSLFLTKSYPFCGRARKRTTCSHRSRG